MQSVCTGIDTLVQLEKSLEASEDITERIPEAIRNKNLQFKFLQ